MINSQPSPRTEPIGKHLSQEKLFQFLSDEVSPAEKQELELHLQTCPLCREALEGFAETDHLKSQADLLELNHLLKKRTSRRKPNTLVNDIKTWGIATAIVFLLLISAAIVWNVVHTSKPAPANNSAPTGPGVTLYARPVKGYDHLNQYLRQAQAQATSNAGKTTFQKGKVILSFTVNPDSSLSHFNVLKSLGKETDNLAIEIVKKGPGWQPGSKQGQIVAQKVTLPVIFK
ncbi:energy transducer TonB [Adhaeribacter swui]|uniref:Energy transducer TonB n=1 Tax=Adhaeribacter swui TaxID=2086471 RepID=A0A7G7GA86_9BACT|nr:energy transducer TonB [Adhaeribacter swui]QNF34070.1 energy transducer TonB [Adhaeribacter swui]